MNTKVLQDWFPEAQISDQPVEKEGYLTLPLASQQWILLEETGSVRKPSLSIGWSTI